MNVAFLKAREDLQDHLARPRFRLGWLSLFGDSWFYAQLPFSHGKMSQWNLVKDLKISADNLFCLWGQHHAFVAVLKATMSLAQCVAAKSAGTFDSKLWVWSVRNQNLWVFTCFCGVGFVSLIYFLIFSSYLGSQTSGWFRRSGKPPLVTSCEEWRWTQTHASQLILQAGNMVEEDPFLLKLYRKLSWTPFHLLRWV